MTKLYSVPEASKLLGCSERHLRELIEIGCIQSIIIGRGNKILEKDLEDFLDTYKGFDLSSHQKALEAFNIIQRRKEAKDR